MNIKYTFTALLPLFVIGCATPHSSSFKEELIYSSKEQREANLIGTFNYASGSGPKDIEINLTVSKTPASNSLTVAFQASHTDASDAAPDGDGVGKIDANGFLKFTFEDSFHNIGTGTFGQGKDGFELSISIDKVEDPRCLTFYRDITLTKVSSSLQQ